MKNNLRHLSDRVWLTHEVVGIWRPSSAWPGCPGGSPQSEGWADPPWRNAWASPLCTRGTNSRSDDLVLSAVTTCHRTIVLLKIVKKCSVYRIGKIIQKHCRTSWKKKYLGEKEN